MTTLKQNAHYKIQFNGSASYFVIDSADQCLIVLPTLRIAENFYKRVSANQGLYN